MSGSKYFVYGERWRELDASTGLVAGWARPVHFVYVRRGRLRVAKRRRVLSALQTFAGHRPSAVGLGVRLTMFSNDQVERYTKKKESPSLESRNIDLPQCIPPASCMHSAQCGQLALCMQPAPCGQHQCCTHIRGCNNNCVTQISNEVPQQSATGVTHIPPPPSNDHTLNISITNNTTHVPTNIIEDNKSANNKNNIRTNQFVTLLEEHSVNTKRSRKSESDVNKNYEKSKRKHIGRQEEKNNDQTKKKNRGTHKKVDETEEDDESSDELCKELTIPDSDVRALRSYVARMRRDALVRFDTDDQYKLALFYAINPLVYVTRCSQTERAIRERHPIALAPFAARLGLTPSPRTCVENTTRKSRRLNTQSHQGLNNFLSNTNRKYIGSNSDDSEDEAFQQSSRNKRRSLRNKVVVPSTKYEANEQKINVNIHNQTARYDKNKESVKNKTVNVKKKDPKTTTSNGGQQIKRRSLRSTSRSRGNVSDDISDTDNKSVRNKQVSHDKKNEIEKYVIHNTDSDSSSVRQKEYKRNSLRKPNTQAKQKLQESSGDETSETDEDFVNSKRLLARTNKFEKRKVQGSENNSDNEIEKENRRSSLRNKSNQREPVSSTKDSGQIDKKSIANKSKINEFEKLKTKGSENNSKKENEKENRRCSLRKKTEQKRQTSIANDSSETDEKSVNKRTPLGKKTETYNNRGLTTAREKEKDHKLNNLRDSNLNQTKQKVSSSNDTSDTDEKSVNNKRTVLNKKTNAHNTEKSYSSSDNMQYKRNGRNSRTNEKQQLNGRGLHTNDKNNRIENRFLLKKRNAKQKKSDNQGLSDEEDSTNSETDDTSSDEGLHKKNVAQKENNKGTNQIKSVEHSKHSSQKKILDRDKAIEDKLGKDMATSTSGDRNDFKQSVVVVTKLKKHLVDTTTNTEKQVIHKTTLTNKEPHVISKRGMNEYSNMEDHAIVAWVLNGGRASKVNGNVLWKELSEKFSNITGINRSWHSLRNRYLRYILPSLGSLGLARVDESRLRAAAATGEIKSKLGKVDPARRNSLFKVNEVQAASRPKRLPPTPGPKSPEKQTEENTEVNQNVGRHSTRSSRAAEIAQSSAPATSVTKSKTRKLYNPKHVC